MTGMVNRWILALPLALAAGCVHTTSPAPEGAGSASVDSVRPASPRPTASSDDEEASEGAAPSAGLGTMRVLAFADTNRVRITVEVPGGRSGARVRGRIIDAATGAGMWAGDLGRTADSSGIAVAGGTVEGIHPKLWSPSSPNLYYLAVQVDRGPADTVRFGFRRFEAKDGRFYLNGQPIFLRGNAINPPERMIPDSVHESRRFAEDYIRGLKASGVNIIRLTRHSQTWFDVADELGMMFFQGHYGTPQGGTSNSPPDRPLGESLRWYRDTVLGPLVNHPSVAIYVLSNEQAADEISYMRRGAAEVNAFLTAVHDSLSRWDDSRPYIGNAGYGFGRAGEVCDIHRYWGWYYNSFLSFYELRNPRICWRTDTPQPITLTENTGNYTGPDGRYNLASGTKQPDSQLNWTGHAPDSEQSARSMEYQAFVAKQAIEITRRLRERNPYLSGLMPFSILFRNWYGIGGYADMAPKPIVAQYAVSYQPILLSWEMWTPQVYAGATLRPIAHVVNDAEDGRDLSNLAVHWSLVDANGAIRASGMERVQDVAFYAAKSNPMSIPVPANLATGQYTLRGALTSGADTVSRNEVPVWVASREWTGRVGQTERSVAVMDDARNRTSGALQRLGVQARAIASADALDPARDLLVIGAGAWTPAMNAQAARIKAFVNAGGRVIVLEQDPAAFDASWLPVPVRLQTQPLDHPDNYPEGRPYRNGMSANPERPDHPALAGIDRDRLFLWSDPTGWDESRSGFPGVYPVTQGFVVTDRARMGQVSVLANYDHGLEGIALAELFEGRGAVIVSGFGVIDRVGVDPVADRLLANLVSYGARRTAAPAHPLIDSRIVWGDYASERGVLTGIYSGLLLNTVPVVPEGVKARYPYQVDERGFHFAGARGGWNTHPSVQYVGKGRRPFGPYGFTLGGSVQLPRGAAPAGEGTFWLRLPAGRTEMLTTVWNPGDAAYELEIVIDGASARHTVPAGQTVQLRTPVRATVGDAHGITFRGDRRLVVMETDFR